LVLGVGRHAEEDRLGQQADGGDAQQPGEVAARHVIATLRRRFGSCARIRAASGLNYTGGHRGERVENWPCRRRLKTLPLPFGGAGGVTSFRASGSGRSSRRRAWLSTRW